MIRNIIYCDGSCPDNGNPKALGGWAWLLVRDPDKPLDNQTIEALESGYLLPNPATPNTSIRSEMIAIIEGLSYLSCSSNIVLYSDSAYCINGLKQKWYKRWFQTGKNSLGKVPANIDLWKRLAELDQFHQITPIHIKGHSGHRWQELVDSLAQQRSSEAKLIVNRG